MIPDLDLAGAVCWLLEGEGNECAEQLENAELDRRWLGEFLDPLPAEGHGLAVEGGKGGRAGRRISDGEIVAIVLRAVFAAGGL
jgi:hypothetical protein